VSGRIEAVCVSGNDLYRLPTRPSGIDKRPVTGRVAVHPLGLEGDVQVNKKHHGGEGQAVYAYAQEDAVWWEAELARFWGIPDLVKRFAAHGATGAYLRVLHTGEIGAGDAVDVVDRPDHGITVGQAFRIVTTERSRLPQLEPALAHLPLKDQPKLAAKIAARTAA
jgi:MOSC domain-containing protein YiiM